ncbi:hypothetical protein D3C81_1735600 [compost metagenome]
MLLQRPLARTALQADAIGQFVDFLATVQLAVKVEQRLGRVLCPPRHLVGQQFHFQSAECFGTGITASWREGLRHLVQTLAQRRVPMGVLQQIPHSRTQAIRIPSRFH